MRQVPEAPGLPGHCGRIGDLDLPAVVVSEDDEWGLAAMLVIRDPEAFGCTLWQLDDPHATDPTFP